MFFLDLPSASLIVKLPEVVTNQRKVESSYTVASSNTEKKN